MNLDRARIWLRLVEWCLQPRGELAHRGNVEVEHPIQSGHGPLLRGAVEFRGRKLRVQGEFDVGLLATGQLCKGVDGEIGCNRLAIECHPTLQGQRAFGLGHGGAERHVRGVDRLARGVIAIGKLPLLEFEVA